MTTNTTPPAPDKAAEITEAQVVAFLKAKADSLLVKYPQINSACVSAHFRAERCTDGASSAYVHLIGSGFHEVGIQNTFAESEADAARKIETPEKLIAKARAEFDRAAANLAKLEGRT